MTDNDNRRVFCDEHNYPCPSSMTCELLGFRPLTGPNSATGAETFYGCCPQQQEERPSEPGITLI